MENVPNGTGNQAYTVRPTGHTPESGKKGKFKKHQTKISVVIIGLLVLLALGLFGWSLYRSSTAASIDGGKYQAVFLSNGQVYFGKLQHLNGSYMKLSDIFYLQAQSSEEGDSENPRETADDESDVQLIKLGSEVHGPEDEMVINKDEILFFENLRTDGKVSDSISKYRSGQ